MAKQSFNANHPELNPGEEFYMNIKGDVQTVGNVLRHQLRNNPEFIWRVGDTAYATTGEVVEGSVPLFRRKKHPDHGLTAEEVLILRKPLTEGELMGTGKFDPNSDGCVIHDEEPDPTFDIDRIFPGDLKPGAKVTYTPTGEKGIVKSESQNSTRFVYVVFNCGGNWKNYNLYTAASTPIKDLKIGWPDGE